MTITDELALIVSERDQLKRENESLKIRLAKNAGALEESRAENRTGIREAMARIEKLAAQNARYDKHFRDALGSGEHIIKARTELNPPVIITPAPEAPNTILGKLTRLGLKTEAA